MLDTKKIYLTEEGLAQLQKEYNDLVKGRRPEVLDRVSQARDLGDLSENAEYHAAKDELSFIDGRISEIEEILKHSSIIHEEVQADGERIVQLGSTVTLHHNDKKDVYTVVGEWEADPKEKKISHESPLGKVLMGKGVGAKVEVDAPVGKITYTVVDVK